MIAEDGYIKTAKFVMDYPVPPEPYIFAGYGMADGGDLILEGFQWIGADPGSTGLIARRKKPGLVEMLDTLLGESGWKHDYKQTRDGLRARLAEIDAGAFWQGGDK